MALMILYTIVPFEVIFAEDDEEDRSYGTQDQLVDLDGVRLLIRPDGTGGGLVTRILSTDPQDYLDRRWQPGSRVRI